MTQWIFSSSVLILGILILRQILKGRISLRLQYALWLLVLVRLLCPVNFFQSGMSIQNAIVPMQMQTTQVAPNPPAVDLPEDNPDQHLPDAVLPENPAPELQPPEQAPQTPDISVTPQPETSKPLSIQWDTVLLILWILGAVGMFSFTMGANIQFGRMLARNRTEVDIPVSAVPVYASSAVKTPCLVGVFRPVIYLTQEVAQDRDSWSHVIRHELTHLDHFDHVFSFLRCFALCLHWFNPLVWIAARVSKDDCELACDEGTIARLGEEQRIPYGQTLIRMTCRSTKPSDLMIAATTMVGSKSAFKERINLIAKRPRTLAAALILCVVAIAVMVGCTFTGAVDPTEPEESTPPTETTEPVETTEPFASTIPEDFVRLDTLLEGTEIRVTHDNWIITLFEDDLVLKLLQNSRNVYRVYNGYGYLMAVMAEAPLIEHDVVYVHEDFYHDFLCMYGTKEPSLFHSCVYLPEEIVGALSLTDPSSNARIMKILEAVTEPSSMGIEIPRIEMRRVLQTQIGVPLPKTVSDELKAIGAHNYRRDSLYYTESEILNNSVSVRSAGLANSMKTYPELKDISPDEMTVTQYLYWTSYYNTLNSYNNLSAARKAFLEEKNILFDDLSYLRKFYFDDYMNCTDEDLIDALETCYQANYGFITDLVPKKPTPEELAQQELENAFPDATPEELEEAVEIVRIVKDMLIAHVTNTHMYTDEDWSGYTVLSLNESWDSTGFTHDGEWITIGEFRDIMEFLQEYERYWKHVRQLNNLTGENWSPAAWIRSIEINGDTAFVTAHAGATFHYTGLTDSSSFIDDFEVVLIQVEGEWLIGDVLDIWDMYHGQFRREGYFDADALIEEAEAAIAKQNNG